MKTIISSVLTTMVMLMAIGGYGQTVLTGAQVATVKNGDHELLIPTDRIQTGLKKLFGPAKKDLAVRSAHVITHKGQHYLEVSGQKHETCLIPLTEKDGILFEVIGTENRIVLCIGKGEGCQPRLTYNGWHCSESPEECEKTVALSDHSIFD
jgi:hypothetical protein